jgi:photosystem II stability/assembly factor-like uncharacterized protein
MRNERRFEGDQRSHCGEPQGVPKLLSQRNRALEWRTRWFEVSRSSDDKLLGRVQAQAYAHKRRLIEKAGPGTGARAGYDPAGAGSPWYCIGPRNVNGRVKSLAVHPTDPDTVYAGSASGGVWKSTDGGQTWNALWDMQETLAIGALAIAPGTPTTLYAGTGEWTPGWGPSYPGAGVYVSTDSGATWSKRASCACRRIGKLVVDPSDSLRLWICGDAGLERSEDGGVSWTLLRSDMVTDIAFDAGAGTLYIAVAGTGYFKSTDHGTSFTALAGAPSGPGVVFPQIAHGVSGAHGHSFIVVRSNGQIQYSTDGGTTFTAISGSHGTGYNGWCDVVACAPDNEQILFSGGVGMDRTTDGGTTWSGLAVHGDQHALVFAPSNSSILYIANDGGVYRSDDKGASVRKVSNGLVITQFYNINFWRTLSNVVGGGAQDNATNYTTSGLTWRPVWTNDGGWFVIDPTDPRVMYAEGQNAYLAKSTDGGATWTPKTSGITGTTPWEGVLTMDPNDHLRLYYGTDRVLRTLDGCATAWTTVSQTLTGEVSAIAVSPADSNRVYVGTNAGHLYRSDDGGATSPWTDKTGTLPGRGISSIWTDPANADHLLVSIAGISATAAAHSVYESTNGGNSWTDVSGDLPVVPANSVVVDPSSAVTMYLATDGGVYRTTDHGLHWVPFDNGIPNVPVSDLVIDSAQHLLYAGTFGRGAYKLDITPAVVKPAVDLYLRDDDLDTGERLPSPSGLPDPLVPAPANAVWWTSPDIKVNHTPYYAPSGVFDGVDFDATLVHQDPYRGQTNRFYLQVHNRGWQTAHSVSVRAFVADASLGLPSLPNALVAPSFNLTSTAVWTPVGPAQTIAVLEPNRPVIVTWDFALPIAAATHTCCLAVISSPDDPFSNASTDVGALVTGDKRVCLKNLHVVDPGPAPMGMSMSSIDLHNPHDHAVWADLVVRPSLFGRGTIGLLLPEIQLEDPERSLLNFSLVPLHPDDPIGEWYIPRRAGCAADRERMAAALAERFAALDRRALWQASSSAVSVLRGIRLAPRAALKGALVCSVKRDAAAAEAPRVILEQYIDGKLAGGSTFQVGYDAAATTAVRPTARRVRLRAEKLVWTEARDRHHQTNVLWARVTIADDLDRTVLRRLGDASELAHARCLFDGILLDGEPLTLELIELERPGDPNHGERLYAHRFEDRIDGWLGHHAIEGREHLRGHYRVEEVSAAPADDTD